MVERDRWNNLIKIYYVITLHFLGFDLKLLKMFKEILATISSRTPINPKNFKEYCLKAARRYAKIYDWYYMSTSVHILLIHGYRMIEQFPDNTCGDKSEEPIETSHKHLKHYRKQNSRKTSR